MRWGCDKTKWHRKFAWFPTTVRPRWVWLEFYEEKHVYKGWDTTDVYRRFID